MKWNVILENEILFAGTYFEACKFRRDNMLVDAKLEIAINSSFNYIKTKLPYIPEFKTTEYA